MKTMPSRTTLTVLRFSWCHTACLTDQCREFLRISPMQNILTLPGLIAANQIVYHPNLVTRQ